jgi:hypothetical protein
VVSPSAKRWAVKMSVQEGIGKVAAACRALGLSRSSYYRRGRSSLESRRIRKEVPVDTSAGWWVSVREVLPAVVGSRVRAQWTEG